MSFLVTTLKQCIQWVRSPLGLLTPSKSNILIESFEERRKGTNGGKKEKEWERKKKRKSNPVYDMLFHPHYANTCSKRFSAHRWNFPRRTANRRWIEYISATQQIKFGWIIRFHSLVLRNSFESYVHQGSYCPWTLQMYLSFVITACMRLAWMFLSLCRERYIVNAQSTEGILLFQ